MTLSLDRRAHLWDDRTAITDHTTNTSYSYADLDTLATDYVATLTANDVEQGDAVVVLAENHPDVIALAAATCRLDATLAPISHRLPAETVATLCDRIDPTHCLYDDPFQGLLPSGIPATPFSSTDSNPASTGSTVAIKDRTHPRFYLHTGGTTGTPKVVPISARQVEWNCITEIAAWGLGRGTVAPVLLPLFHTGGWLLLTLPTLYVGGHVVMHHHFDPDAALTMIEDYGATQVFGVAAMFEAMANHDRFEETDFSTVDWFMSGGGPTPDAVIEDYHDQDQTFVQGYGLTEGGPNNLYTDPTRPDAHVKPDRVGRPFPDCAIRIVDETGDSVGVDTIGELEVAGPITADGYLVTNDGTFDSDWVSTGDLAEQDTDGDIAIVGRTDNMFISGGENVYPEPIEGILETHPDVSAVGIIGLPHDKWGTVPKAIVVGDTDAPTLDAYAQEHLAAYEQPTTYQFVKTLPRSGPGKLDREALQAEYGQ